MIVIDLDEPYNFGHKKLYRCVTCNIVVYFSTVLVIEIKPL